MEKEKSEVKEAEYLEGFAITGEYVKNLTNKGFKILERPKYVELPDLDDPTKLKRKLVLSIMIMEDSSLTEYYPNKTSQKTISNTAGMKLENWIGYEGTFKTVEQNVRGQMKPVIYVEEK